MRKYITMGKSVAPKKQVSSVAGTSSTSPTTFEIAATRGAEKLESKSS